MQDLFLDVVIGAGFIVRNKVVNPCNYDLPDERQEEDENDFKIYVYGHPILPADSKSFVSRTRNLIGVLDCHFVGFCRDFNNPVLDTACASVEKLLSGDLQREVIVVKNLLFDAGETEDVEEMLSNLYNIVTYVTGTYFDDAEGSVVCVYANNEEIAEIEKSNSWSGYFIDKDNGILILTD